MEGKKVARGIWWYTKKVIAVVAILLVMYLLVGFFWWHYVTELTIETEGSRQIMEAIAPVVTFFQPAVDFYTWAADSVSSWFNSAVSSSSGASSSS